MNRDREGLQVLVDLQGGNPDDPAAMSVFEEIKDKVMTEVRRFPLEIVVIQKIAAGIRRTANVHSDVEKIQTPCIGCDVLASLCATRKLMHVSCHAI